MQKIMLSTALAVALGLSACNDPATDRDVTSPGITYDRSTHDMALLDWIDQQVEAGHDLSFSDPLDLHAVTFIKLALAIGQHDPNFVDAYSGPALWRDIAKTNPQALNDLADQVQTLRDNLEALETQNTDKDIRLEQLIKQGRAMATRLDVVRGQPVSFNQEVSDIYDVVPPVYDLSEFDAALAEIDALLPGEAPLPDRVTEFRNSLAIPADKLKPVFDRAIEECRSRTQAYYDLPGSEKFNMEFVTDKSWSGYNYYQGDYESLIQMNTDFPIIIDRAVDLGCHEGYPGHHVWNLFVESELVNERGWIEYSVQPLFGPFGPIAEGSANYGIDLAFPGDEKMTFEKEVLYPMAGLDPSQADKLAELGRLTGKLTHATNEISRQYLDGQITREEAIPLIQKYYLASAEKSEQRVRFIETYRGYVINYNMGKDLVREYIAASGDAPDAHWKAFQNILTQPMTASDIVDELKPK